MAIIIKEAVSKKDIKVFMDFPNKLYKNEPNFVPYILMDDINSADPKKNLSLEFCDTVLYLAYKDNKVVGRIRALINHKFNKKDNVLHLRFNHFDYIDDFEVSEALFNKIVEWGKERGMTEVNGPIGFNDLDKQGMLIEGFEYEGMFITYYNFPYYIKHMDNLGLVKDVDWVEYRVQIPKEVNPRLLKIQDRLLSRSEYSVKKITSKRELKPYLYKIFDIYNQAFAPLHGSTIITQAQIDQYVKQYLPVINLDYLSVLIDKEDNVVAFGLLVPSLNQAMKKSNGRLFPFGFIRVLRNLKRARVLDMYLVAVSPDQQGLGLNSILMSEITKSAMRNNVEFAETGPELEDNTKVQGFWKNYDAEKVRRRRCYIKKIK